MCDGERDIVMAFLPVYLSVRLSVRLSVQCRYCVQTNGHVIKRFDDLVAASLAPTLQTSKGDPLSGGVIYTGWENFANITLYLGNCTR